MKNFHQFIKEKRMEKQITLREFCRSAEVDPSNWSKIERGLSEAPKSKDFINRIATVLELDAEEKATLHDLAIIESIPEDLRPDEEILEKLPIFFRTVRGDKPSEEELKQLIKLISQS